MRITPNAGFRDFKNKKGNIIKSNGKALRIQDFEGNYNRNSIINYMEEFCERAKQRDPTVRYTVVLKFSNGEYSNGTIQGIDEHVQLQDVFYDTHTDDEIVGFRIIIIR